MTDRELIGKEELGNKVVNYYVRKGSSKLFVAGSCLLVEHCDILPTMQKERKVAEFVLSQANDEVVGVKANIESNVDRQLILLDYENTATDQPTLHYEFHSLTFFCGTLSTQSLITLRAFDPLEDRDPFTTEIIQRSVKAFCDNPVLELAN